MQRRNLILVLLIHGRGAAAERQRHPRAGCLWVLRHRRPVQFRRYHGDRDANPARLRRRHRHRGPGFPVQLYGTGYSQTCISANGLLAFGGCDPSAAHVNLATTGTFNNLPTIAPLWDDWQFFTPGTDAVYFETTGAPGSQLFIVEWSLAKGNFPYSPGTATFEAILSEAGGNILLQYLNVASQD